ncbi:MAG: DNA replication/repair protein RecF [Clostridia bacterium]
MYIKELTYKNFRNLKDNTIVPNKEINVVFGDNAQGKTNLLEGIWIFTGGHSFRGNKDVELTKLIDGKNCKNASLKIDFFSEDREQNAVLNIEQGRRNSVINGVKKNTGSALVGKICAVIFSPEHLRLIKDGPAMRRSFIDAAICQITPSYASSLMKYNRVILQRNAFLKEFQIKKEYENMLSIWDEKAVELGFEIALKRYIYIENLKKKAKEIYTGISCGKETIDISYKPLSLDFNEETSDFKEKYFELLKKSHNIDIKIGSTSVGVHRDDIDIFINDTKARTYASQGQQRSAVIALKLSEAQILEEKIFETPIIILDDVMSELDNNRQDYILNRLKGRQIFISCCSPETVSLMEKGKMFEIKDGTVL